MAELLAALEQYREDVARKGHNLFSIYARGLERSEVIARLEAAGLDPVDDAVDWFSFINGKRKIPPTNPHLVGSFDHLLLVSLDEALAEREARLDPEYHLKTGLDEDQFREMREADFLQPFHSSWLPISHGQQTLAIETDRSARRFGRLVVLWNDEIEVAHMDVGPAQWVADLPMDKVRWSSEAGASASSMPQ